MTCPKEATILITNHNYGKWLENAVKSAKAQDYPFTSVHVIDDGSTDNSKEVIDNLAYLINSYSLHETAKGPSAGRNTGIRETWCSTDVWFVLDADDEMEPNKVSKFMEIFEDPNIGFVYADYDTYNDEDKILTRNYKEPYSKLRLHQECIVHSSAAFSKEAILKAKINPDMVFDEDMRTAEDWNLWLQLSKASMGYHIPESLTKVRIHNNNATNSVSSEIWQKNWQKIRERLNNGYY